MHITAKSTQRGVSIMEALTVLLIISILLGMSTPPMQQTLARTQASANFRVLISSLNLARTYAVTKKTITTFCPSDDGHHCGGEWGKGSILFSDRNNNRILDEEDIMIEVGPTFSGQASLSWRASAGRNSYIRFSPSGAAREFGTFTYCANTGHAMHDKMLIINRMGRLRIAQDSDGDGIVENKNGGTPSC